MKSPTYPIKAFLLAAGLGTRLRPLTDDIPKCLLPINGQPLLQIWLEHLNKHGVDEVLVNSHWLHEKVEDFVKQRVNKYSLLVNGEKNIERKGCRGEGERNTTWPEVRLFHEPDLLGSARTLLANKDWVSDGNPFFILYGDNLTNVDLTKMYAFHCDHSFPFTLGVFKTDTPERCGIAEVNEDGVVTDFREKPNIPQSDLAAAGIYITDKSIFDFFPQKEDSLGPMDLGYHVIPNLVWKMKAYVIEEFLVDIGTIASYEKAQLEWVSR